MSAWQIVLIVAAVWLVGMVLVVVCWPAIARRLRQQHRPPHDDHGREAPR